jgi:hypothetical protein
MTTNQQHTDQPHESIYTYALLFGIFTGWKYQSIPVGVMATITAVIAIYMYRGGYWLQLCEWIKPHVITTYKAIIAYLTKTEQTEEIKSPYEWSPGKEVDTGKFIVTDLEETGSFGTYAITRAGKTSFIHSFLYQLFTTCGPEEIQFVIADLKNGLDFRIFRRLKHLALPVAETTKEAEKQMAWLIQEKERRSKLFKAIPEDKLCNNLTLYHKLGEPLGLPRLPRIVAIFDEFQNITLENESALNDLTILAKEGQAFGITVHPCTQLPNVEALPTKLKSQFFTWFCGYLSNASHYYKIAEIAKEIWEPFHLNGKIVGRFIANISGELMIIQSIYIPNKQLETAVAYYSNEVEPEWPKIVIPEKIDFEWRGSNAEKKAKLIKWLAGLDHEPTAEESAETFGFSLATYDNWGIADMWQQLQKK